MYINKHKYCHDLKPETLYWFIYTTTILALLLFFCTEVFAIEDPWNNGGQPSEITPAPPIIEPPGNCLSKIDGKCLPFVDDFEAVDCNNHVSAALITYVRENNAWTDCANVANQYYLGLFLFGYSKELPLTNAQKFEEPKWLEHTYYPIGFCSRTYLYWKDQIKKMQQARQACAETKRLLSALLESKPDKATIYFVIHKLAPLLGWESAF